jgi:Phage integrase family
VRRQLLQLGHEVCVGLPKTKSGEDRMLELPPGTVTVLLKHRLLQDAERKVRCAAWQASPKLLGERERPVALKRLVFTREDGTPLHPAYVTRHFQLLAARAGLRRIRLHDLRHGAASLRLAAGVPIEIVSKILGHSRIALTADTYSQLLQAVARHAAEAAAALVPRTEPPARDHHVPTGPSETTLAIPSNEEKARSEVVRRQGLEPRTRRLRVPTRGVQAGPAECISAGHRPARTTADSRASV